MRHLAAGLEAIQFRKVATSAVDLAVSSGYRTTWIVSGVDQIARPLPLHFIFTRPRRGSRSYLTECAGADNVRVNSIPTWAHTHMCGYVRNNTHHVPHARPVLFAQYGRTKGETGTVFDTKIEAHAL